MTVTPTPPSVVLLPPTLEYMVVPADPKSGLVGGVPSENGSPLIWQDFKFLDIEDTIAGETVQVVGHRVFCRCYQIQVTYDENGEEVSRIKILLPYTITESHLAVASPHPQVFVGQIDPPDTPTTLYGPAPGSYNIGEWAEGGIRDNSAYDYYKVFDEAEVSWLPRVSSIEQEFIEPGEHGFHYPYEPEVDENRPRPKYPIDTISSWLPDERESVDVNYNVFVNGTPFGNNGATILQTVYQDMNDFTKKLKKVLNRCYFTHGLYHNSVYLNEADRNYDERGVIRGNPVEIYDVDDNLVRTESYNDIGELISVVREPIYPIEGVLIPIVEWDEELDTYGQLAGVLISNPGAFYPKSFLLKFRNTSWFDAGGEAPIARAIVSPIVRGEPEEVPVTLPDGTVQLQMREGSLVGGEIIEIEIINPGSGMRSIESVDMKTTTLSNTRYDYNEGFISNRSLEPKIPINERTEDD